MSVILKNTLDSKTPHRGRPVVRNCLDSFEVTGSIGNHLCLAYEPAREPLWIVQKRFETERFPLSMAKGYILIILAGLDYLHSECRVVHTGKVPSYFRNMYPQITDFGAATLLGNDGHDGTVQLGTRPIQPDYYRAPEVVLGCGWSFSAEFGCYGKRLY
jgi:serine/threonine protein kinase